MKFGERIRQLRKANEFSLRELAEQVDVTFTYLSKVENQKLDFGEYPSEALIHKLAESLHADENELLILAEKIPDRVRQMFLESPDTFLRLANVGRRLRGKVLSGVENQLDEAVSGKSK